MPEGTYTMLKPTNGRPVFAEKDTGAHYYAYAGSGSVSKYQKISGTIILPNNIRLVGTGGGRNAFISLGISTKEGTGIDIGLRNRGLDGGGDSGYGWHPCCMEVGPDIGWYYDGQANSRFPIQEDHKAPWNARRARFEVEPNPDGKRIRFSVTWLDENSIPVGKFFQKEIPMERTYHWDRFYRFASLVPWPPTAANNDSTYMLGGEFFDMKIGSANWGISTSQINQAWIMHHPKCQLPDGYWATGEQFRIDHWA